MKQFDDIEAIKKIDPQNTLGSTEMLVKQCEAAWKQVQSLTFPKKISGIKNIVFCGMGASIYGGLVVKSLLRNQSPYPIEIITDYHIPDYVDENSLIVLTSYSGTTEEVLSCAQEAKVRHAQILVVTKGGELATFAKSNNIPAYIFDGKLNPAGIPRLGNGYTILGLIGLLSKFGIITIEEQEITNVIIRLKEKHQEIKSKAMSDYALFINKLPIIFSAEHLSGNAQIFRNQFNETSKTFSSFFIIPDLNHHLMEGLQFPKEAKFHFIIVNSPNYSEKIRKRVELTNEVVKKNNHEVYEFMTSGQTIYDDFLETLAFGSYLTLYLALYYDQNPAINPWVDYFKEKLKSEA